MISLNGKWYPFLDPNALIEKHTLHSGTYLHSTYMAVPPPPPPGLQSSLCLGILFNSLEMVYVKNSKFTNSKWGRIADKIDQNWFVWRKHALWQVIFYSFFIIIIFRLSFRFLSCIYDCADLLLIRANFFLAMKEIPTGVMQRLYSYVENESNFHVLMCFNLRHKVDNLPYFNHCHRSHEFQENELDTKERC